MKPTPSVSVVIPTYNRKDYLQEAIDSVLAQTYSDYEIIVVDDGSTDGTGEALRARYGDRIHYLWQENQGESAARNQGIETAEGEFVAFLDSDDFWLPEKLTRQVSFLSANPHVAMVFSRVWRVGPYGERLIQDPSIQRTTSQDLIFEALCFRNTVGSPSSILVRKAVLDNVGGFDPEIQYGEDWDLWLRIGRDHSIELLHEPLACIRLHAMAQWFLPKKESVAASLNDHLRLLRKAFENRMENSEHWANLQSRSLAYQYAQAAFNGYARGLYRAAKEWLTIAMTLDPDMWENQEQIMNQLYERGFALIELSEIASPKEIDIFVQQSIAYWPEQLSPPLRNEIRKLCALLQAEKGYRHYIASEYQSAVLFLRHALLTDPRYWTDRGFVKRLIAATFRGVLPTSQLR